MPNLNSTLRSMRDWLVVSGAVLLSLGLASGYLALTPRTYVATSNVFVSMRSADAATTYLRGTFSVIRVQSYTALATSPGVLRAAIEQISPGYPIERLAAQVTATVIPQTVLLQVTMSSEDRDQASRFAQAIAEAVAARGTDLEQVGSRNDAPITLTPLGDVFVSDSPLSPSVPRILTLALLLGLFSGLLGLSALRARLALRGSESAGGTIAGLDVIARIERHSLADLAPDRSGRNAVLEQLRILRTNLSFAPVSHAGQVVCVTSPNAREGRTSTALGLALALTESSQRVLLIDGDLRHRALSELLVPHDHVGVSDLVLRVATEGDCITPDARGFDFMGGGSRVPNPADLLSSERLRDVVNELAATYDHIVIDTPPLRDVADAALWGSHSGTSIVLSRHARTRTVSLIDAVKSLERAHAHVAGVVVTAAR